MSKTKSLIFGFMSGRKGMALALAAAIGAGAIVFWVEHWGGLQPCALCWTQRLLLGTFAILALGTLIAWPRSIRGRTVLGGALVVTALAGTAVAVRHIYVVWNPEIVECGLSPEVMVQMLPWRELILEFITGQSDCARAGDLLGVPLPLWSLVGFIALAVVTAFAVFRVGTSNFPSKKKDFPDGN